MSWIPGNIFIDNSILFRYFLNYAIGAEFEQQKWSRLFNLSNAAFHRKNYKFTGKIFTDGISCCVLLQAEGYTNSYQGVEKDAEENEDAAVDDEEKEHEYLNESNINQVGKRFVVIDPNKRDLMFCLGSNGKNLRYTYPD